MVTGQWSFLGQALNSADRLIVYFAALGLELRRCGLRVALDGLGVGNFGRKSFLQVHFLDKKSRPA